MNRLCGCSYLGKNFGLKVHTIQRCRGDGNIGVNLAIPARRLVSGTRRGGR